MEIGVSSCVVEVLWYQKFVASSRPSVGRVKSNEIVDVELISY